MISYLFVLLVALATLDAQLIALQAKFNNASIKFLNNIMNNLLKNEVSKVVIPDYTIPVSMALGSGQIKMKGLKIANFQESHFFLRPHPSGILLEHNSNAPDIIEIAGNYELYYKILFHETKDKGTMNFKISNITLSMLYTFAKRNNKPEIAIAQCKVKANVTYDIAFNSFVLKVAAAVARSSIDNIINEQKAHICYYLKLFLKNVVNARLQTMPRRMELADNIFIHYSFPRFPIIPKTDSIGVMLYANVTYGKEPCPSAKSVKYPEMTNNNSMVQIRFSVHLLQCLASSIHKGGIIEGKISAKDEKLLAFFLTTSCRRICIGKLFTKLEEKHPNSGVDLYIKFAKKPLIEMEEAGINISASFLVDLHLTSIDKNKEKFATIELNISAKLLPKIKGNILFGQLNGFVLSVKQIKSSVGEIDQKFLQYIQKNFLEKIILTAVKARLKAGLAIPSIYNISINITKFIMKNGYMQVDVNLKNINEKENEKGIIDDKKKIYLEKEEENGDEEKHKKNKTKKNKKDKNKKKKNNESDEDSEDDNDKDDDDDNDKKKKTRRKETFTLKKKFKIKFENDD